MRRYLTGLVLAIVALGTLLAAAPAGAAQRTRCFTETGFCMSGVILDYWERNGGLAVFGYPITDLHRATVEGWTGPVQWFERDRLEDHGSTGVLAGRLGARLLEVQGRPWQPGPTMPYNPDCRFFTETGYNMCGTFRRYWEANGGLARFGFPITDPMQETIEGRTLTVQYFERRRMEYHPENAGTKYEVLLGLLGRDLYTTGECADLAPWLRKTAAAYGELLSCLAPNQPINVPIAVETFEHGMMVWVKGQNGADGAIWALYQQPNSNRLYWEYFSDTWKEGDQVSGGEKAPRGLYEPIRGFGKVWRTVAHVRGTLGWATAPEQADTGSALYFKGGAWMIHIGGNDTVMVLRPDYSGEAIGRIQ
jgi:hypothetical protein